MSSILKALRKVEDDKASLGEGSVDLAHDILKGNYTQSRPFSWAMLAVSLVVLLVAGGGLWFWLVISPQGDIEKTTDRMTAELQPNVPAVTVETLPDIAPRGTVELPASAVIPAQSSVESGKAAAPVTSVVIPTLLVEEIVYHENSASRLAVINDLPVMEGTSISGALVEKIYPDRVQFLYQGVRFNKFR